MSVYACICQFKEVSDWTGSTVYTVADQLWTRPFHFHSHAQQPKVPQGSNATSVVIPLQTENKGSLHTANATTIIITTNVLYDCLDIQIYRIMRR